MSGSQNHSQVNTSNQSNHLSSIDQTKDLNENDLNALFKQLLDEGLHGLCFSAYEEGQQPTDILTENQVRRRMSQMAPYTTWTRSFSCIEGNELIPQIAHEFGIKTMVGAWLSDDLEKNEQEIEGLIHLAKNGFVDIAAVGNEVLLRKDLSLDQLVDYIKRVKDALPDIPVGYVDAYHEFTTHPELVDASDVILINCYPYWEGSHIDNSLGHLQSMYNQTKDVAKGKPVIISETGWPSQGSSFKEADATLANFMKYFINTQLWSKKEGIETMYFTSFDESWKVGNEGDVGAYWGLWDKSEIFKV